MVYRVKNNEEVRQKLLEIAYEERLKKVMVSSDEVTEPLNLKAWGQKHDIVVMTPKDYSDRNSFRDAVFDQADAGITGAGHRLAVPTVVPEGAILVRCDSPHPCESHARTPPSGAGRAGY